MRHSAHSSNVFEETENELMTWLTSGNFQNIRTARTTQQQMQKHERLNHTWAEDRTRRSSSEDTQTGGRHVKTCPVPLTVTDAQSELQRGVTSRQPEQSSLTSPQTISAREDWQYYQRYFSERS